MAQNISIRMSYKEMRALDELVEFMEDYWKDMAERHPSLASQIGPTNRSSALRDLLMAWQDGNLDQLRK